MVGKKKSEGVKEPKSVACNEMNAEGMKIESWWSGRRCMHIYISIYLGAYMRISLLVCVHV